MSRIVIIDYTNWKGERRKRLVDPIGMIYGRNEWHVDDQWLLLAWDVEKDESRQFAMKDIHAWEPALELIPE